MQTSTYKSIL